MACLNALTMSLVRPLEAEWCGPICKYMTALTLQNSAMLNDTNPDQGLLSLTNHSGKPCFVNMSCNMFTVCAVAVEIQVYSNPGLGWPYLWV